MTAKLGVEVYVTAKITQSGYEPDRAGALEISVEDVQNQIRSIEQATIQMQAEIERLDKKAGTGTPTRL